MKHPHLVLDMRPVVCADIGEPRSIYERPPPYTRVFDWLYIGDRTTLSGDFIRDKNITTIISFCDQTTYPPHTKVMKIDIADRTDEDIHEFFAPTFEFIRIAHTLGENVLVCCKAGISRSATIVLAYVMRAMGVSFGDAFSMVCEKRCINPNFGFLVQLQKFSENIK